MRRALDSYHVKPPYQLLSVIRPPYDSYMPYEQKRSTLIATLKKVDRMAGNKSERFVSAMHKLKEFADLGYPVRVRQYACYRVERETGQRIWLAVAKQQSAM